MFRNFDFKVFIPHFSSDEQRDMKVYYEFSKEYEKSIQEESQKEFEEHPVIGPIIKSIPKEVQETNNKESDKLLYAAVFEDKWEPYIKNLMMQGVQFAHMGLNFKGWYEVVSIVRKYYTPIVRKINITDKERSFSISNGMNLMFDFAMCIIGESFIHERNRIIEIQNKKQEGMIKELESFAYIISHDLKTPLRGVASIADWLVEDYKDKLDDTGKEYLSLLKSRVVRLESLIDAVLTYSRAGKVDKESELVDFNILVKDVIDMVAPPANVHIKMDNELPKLESVKIPMIQVFTNLIGNAIKHNDKKEIKINIGCEDKNDEWWFYVKDNGPGIDQEFHEKVFKIFQTLKTKDEANNTGIGLSVVKKIIDSIGGRIWIESKHGEGASFIFALKKTNQKLR